MSKILSETPITVLLAVGILSNLTAGLLGIEGAWIHWVFLIATSAGLLLIPFFLIHRKPTGLGKVASWVAIIGYWIYWITSLAQMSGSNMTKYLLVLFPAAFALKTMRSEDIYLFEPILVLHAFVIILG
jgi:hypothetical protein